MSRADGGRRVIKPGLTLSQHLARTTNRAKSHRRLCILQDCAAEGLDLETAAKRAGLKIRGAKDLIYRAFGSYHWPPNG